MLQALTLMLQVNPRCFSVQIVFPCSKNRIPTQPGKPGKTRVHLENLEISWNFEKFNKYHEKMA